MRSRACPRARPAAYPVTSHRSQVREGCYGPVSAIKQVWFWSEGMRIRGVSLPALCESVAFSVHHQDVHPVSKMLFPSTKWARRTLQYRSMVYIPFGLPSKLFLLLTHEQRVKQDQPEQCRHE